MTAQLVVDIVVQVLIMAAWFFIGWNVRATVEARRQRKAAEEASRAFREASLAAMRAMAARFGGEVRERVSPADIRTGDEIHWCAPPGQDCIDYTAGFNGDVAGKTTGEWIRKDQGEDTSS